MVLQRKYLKKAWPNLHPKFMEPDMRYENLAMRKYNLNKSITIKFKMN